jgi:hypothetical protein
LAVVVAALHQAIRPVVALVEAHKDTQITIKRLEAV